MADAALVEEAASKVVGYDDAVVLTALQQILEDRPSVVQELADWMLPDKAYASTRILQDNRLFGTVKSFNPTNGYGFIDCPEVKAAFGNDVFLHGSQLGNFTVGEEVSFAILVNKQRRPQAFDLGPAQGGKDAPRKGAGASGKGAWDGGKAAGAVAWGGAAAGKGAVAAAAWGGKDAWGGGKDPWGAAKGAAKGAGKPAWGGWGPAAPAAAKGAAGKSAGKGAGKVPETSAEIPGVTDVRHVGSIKSFNEEKGYGFIYSDEIMAHFGGDVFLHGSQFAGHEVGATITFEIFLNKNGKPQAKDLLPSDGLEEALAPPTKKLKAGW